MTKIKVRVPATTANLGPGFDTLGLALDLWNETSFNLNADGILVEVSGEGAGTLSTDANNLVASSALRVFKESNVEAPQGLHIKCNNQIPLGSGLGSSAAAVLTGLLGGNALAGNPLSSSQIVRLASEIEGHPDNVAPALLGGLTIVIADGEEIITRKIEVAPITVIVMLPDVKLPTKAARQALPEQVSLKDAVYNIGRNAMVVEALRYGDLELLAKSMQDRLHQSVRLESIPGGQAAISAAQEAGAAAGVSGAGPGIVAFTVKVPDEILGAMQLSFEAEAVKTREFILSISQKGASVEVGK